MPAPYLFRVPMQSRTIALLSLSLLLFFVAGCSRDTENDPLGETRYPQHVEAIIVNKCATAGCHNTTSKDAAGGLDLSTWDNLFRGSRAGAVVIPYRSDFSTLCYYTNTDTLLGITLQPAMPYNETSLSTAEYLTLRNWIETGAPDKYGFVKFSDYQENPKLYIANRGCDVVTIMDPVTGLAMRYIDVGNDTGIEGPCAVQVSPDKQHWYVIFAQGTLLQKFRTSDNAKVGEMTIGTGFWSSLVVTPDSRKVFISDANITGRIVYADVESMQIITEYQTGLHYPYGLHLTTSGLTLYATPREGNFIYKLNVTDPMNPVIAEISLESNTPPSINPALNPRGIVMSPDESLYFVTCDETSELRVMQTAGDSLIATVITGSNPDNLAVSANPPYVFVSCLGVPGTNKHSVVNVYDYISHVSLPEIEAGHDSKGIAVAAGAKKLFVANRNVTAGGPEAHHAPVCDGKNGYITAIDLNTLQLVPGFKAELSVDPYYIGK